MKTKIFPLMLLSLLLSAPVLTAHAQTAKPDAVLIYVVPDTDTDTGFSAKKTFLGKTVYSDDKKKIGTITDLIIAPDTSVAYVVVGAGGFVGLGKHNVAVQTSALRFDDGKFILPGATKESLKAAPKLQYPKKGS